MYLHNPGINFWVGTQNHTDHAITHMTLLLLKFVDYIWQKTLFWDLNVIKSSETVRKCIHCQSVSFANSAPSSFYRDFEFASFVPCQLALFHLERSPPPTNHTAALLEFPGIMPECLGYVNLNYMLILSKCNRCVASSFHLKHRVEIKPSSLGPLTSILMCTLVKGSLYHLW